MTIQSPKTKTGADRVPPTNILPYTNGGTSEESSSSVSEEDNEDSSNQSSEES